jgi:hypothetical protein
VDTGQRFHQAIAERKRTHREVEKGERERLMIERDALLDKQEGSLTYMRATFQLCLGFVW